MARNLAATVQRLALYVAVCCLLVAASTSCVKLPRQRRVINSLLVAQSGTNAAPRININRASRDELEKLPGIGQALASRIIEHRQRYGRFRRAEHLIMVRGIGDRRFRKLQQLITVE